MTFRDLTPETDVSPAAWIVDGVGPFGSGVGSLVPAGFDQYLRVFHPAELDGSAVSWASVAAANGRVAHPGMEWVSIAGAWRYVSEDVQPGLWDRPPADGSLDARAHATLAAVLEKHTSAQRYWFAFWEGYGVLPDEWTRRYPRVPMEQRAMYLFSGTPADAATMLPVFTWDQSPTLWWPDDHAWCVATELDLMSTYVGAGRACADAILTAADLETAQVSREQTVRWDGDLINPTPPRDE